MVLQEIVIDIVTNFRHYITMEDEKPYKNNQVEYRDPLTILNWG